MIAIARLTLTLFAILTIGFFSLSLATEGQAQSTIDKPLENPVDEARALALHKLLRCLVCQNQSISDSNAELARDLRILVRQRIATGETDDQTMAYIVDRYGDWVLLDPPVKSTTYVLWFGPLVIFLLALVGVGLFLRRSKAQPAAQPVALDAGEEARLKTLLDDEHEADT
jgi:cytochrome c-type biogenesis protein CcmH